MVSSPQRNAELARFSKDILNCFFFILLFVCGEKLKCEAFISSSTMNSRYRPSQVKITTLQMTAATKSGARPILTKEDFREQVLSSSSDTNESNIRPIMVFYTGAWCGPCRLSNPVVKEIVKIFGGNLMNENANNGKEGIDLDNNINSNTPLLDVVEISTDDLPEVAEEVGVDNIPTIQIYYKGEVMETIVGCVSKNVLASAVMKVFEDVGVDMDNFQL